ncbi:iron-containing alcohol dehydrogenase [Aspergillus homomorphus CBS 101889]|uniref:Putative Fe-containing alcohol dehydrogenase n=1 Tax=Aspergillus homomorphus (strain CBS 101889) TaxID=1450537 RepID=A0A395HNI1_ASPHC|nr:putative Fe-containing alcohol dehydrogenase [Aspergillus homomorphus CBS 101889]RAL09512.1 putative Fe-containing alcohol dehydrogenase [Aspergillus homomorphus CBS 101889]
MTETVRPAFVDRPRPLLAYGIPFPAAAAHHVDDLFHASRVYIICSASLARNTDALDRLVEAIGEKQVVGKRIGMQSHTLWSEVLEAANAAREAEADCLITLGGGSLTDAAKVVALALANNATTPQALSTLSTGPNQSTDLHPPSIPIISIPTTLSAGEYSSFAGATDDSTHRKHIFGYPTRGPGLVILDPALTTTTPARTWLSTGVRAVDHCVETYCAAQGTTSETDQLSLHALGLLVPGLLRTHCDPADEDARLECQLGSVDAMAAVTAEQGSVQLGASHGISHQLGPLGVPHGETSCILLPAVCKYNAAHEKAEAGAGAGPNRERQEKLKHFLGKRDEVVEVVRRHHAGKDLEQLDLGDVLDAVIRELGMPRSLAEVGIGRQHLDRLAENSLHDRWCQTNPVPLTEKSQVLEILEMVVG